MAELTIRDLPEGVMKTLERRAKAHNRTVESEAKAFLESLLLDEELDVDAVITEAREHQKKIGGYLTDEVLRELKEEGRK